MRKTLLLLAFAAVLAGCASEPAKPKETAAAPPQAAEKKNHYETGRVAFQKTYISARGWAADAKPFRLESNCAYDAPVAEGKCGVWKTVFASATQRGIKPYVWSGIDAPDAPAPGVNPGQEDDYSPSNPNTQPFDLSFLKQDSDKAFEVAQKHGGDKILKKDPKTPVNFSLDWWPKENKLKWHVSYGSGLRVSVDATTGDFLKATK